MPVVSFPFSRNENNVTTRYMKKLFLFLLTLAAISGTFAQMQHSGHQMPVQPAPTPQKTNDVQVAAGSSIYKSRPAKLVRYDLYIGDTTVTFAGKKRPALSINGSIPAPTLNFIEGDTAEIYVHNTLKEETSIHWHGLILPNEQDGVPNLTTAPIKAGTTHKFTFPIVQNGTYWYHSHTGVQEQLGMYGGFIIHKRDEVPMKEMTVVVSDWINENPHQVERSLHNATDWYGIRKGTTQNYGEAIKEGQVKTKAINEWKRMLAMDVSDVAYDQFLVNGQDVAQAPQFKAGDKVRLRIINAGSSSYFWLRYAGGKMSLIGNDGADVEPVEVDRMIIAVAETYDAVVTIPEDKSFEFQATSEDRTKHASLFLGSGPKVAMAPMPKLKYFAGMKMMNDMMTVGGRMKPMEGMEMANQTMDMNTVMYPEITGEEKPGKKAQEHASHDMAGMNMDSAAQDIVTLNYGMLRSPVKTAMPEGPVKTIRFNLTGNMNRYVWSIDNKVLSESDKIKIKKGENVRIILYNGTMMRHPMHLHGHFFRLVNSNGEYSPIKTVADILPMETDTLEFTATDRGDWFFHCHIMYHMMAGMGRVFSIEDSPANTELPNPQKAWRKLAGEDRRAHPMARVGLESNGSDGELMFANTRWRFSTEWRIGLNKAMGYETESHFGRYIGQNQWLLPYIGWDFRKREIDPLEKNMFGQKMRLPGKNLFGQTNTKNFRRAVHVGVQYTLPSLIVADASIDSDKKLRFQLSREDIALSSRLRFSFLANTDKEYAAGLRYIMTKYLSLSTHYDSDMGYGAGITLTY